LKIDGLTGYGSAANPRASGIGAQAATAQNNRHEKVNRIAGIACSFHKFLICKNITNSQFLKIRNQQDLSAANHISGLWILKSDTY
jgi:hypothetical protein